MRILLTNDDGFTSPGITLLSASLRQAGHRVFMVAPDKNRSGASHSIEFLNGPVKLTCIGTDSWSCSGTPVDCIIVALLGGIPDINIVEKSDPSGTSLNYEAAPDLILSGINIGANLGTDITYSGTAAAARQGSFFGIPSVALSLIENEDAEKQWHWEPVISYIIEQIDVFKSYWKTGFFININFPNTGKKPLSLVPVFPSMRYYNDRIQTYSAPEGASLGGVYCFAKTGKTTSHVDGKNMSSPPEGSDWAEVKKGNAALSVVWSEPQVGIFSSKELGK